MEFISNNETAYSAEVEHLVDWGQLNNLSLNVDKTKGVTVDFRNYSPMLIHGSLVETVTNCKFLGLHV